MTLRFETISLRHNRTMATVTSKIFKHHKKTDGTYNVKICVSHKNVTAYINTNHYVSDRQLDKELRIKSPVINRLLNNQLDDYRESISKLGRKLNFIDADNLKEYLLDKDKGIDFIAFCKMHIDNLKQANRNKSASNYKTVLNNLIDFFGSNTLEVEEINVSTLKKYESFLRTERVMIRKDRFGNDIIIKSPGVSDAGIHNYLRDFKGLFSAAQKHYNNPYLGIILIPFNPFDHYHIIDCPETKKRNIAIEQLQQLRDCDLKLKRTQMARDVFMLSFYLCGMNASDMFASQYIIQNDRLEYRRLKTRMKRKDKAFISILIPAEAIPLLSKYQKIIARYSTIDSFNKALSFGMRDLSKITGIADLTFYAARHTFGNLARNTCRKSKDDVALALNHVDQGHKVTDIYLEKDWRIVDEVQKAVLDIIR